MTYWVYVQDEFFWSEYNVNWTDGHMKQTVWKFQLKYFETETR